MKKFVPSILVAVAFVAAPACKSAQMDESDVAAKYRGNNAYEDDIVEGKKRRDYKDQGQSISPKTLANIEDTISHVYEKDFERCLEEEMDSKETRFIRSAFIVEFTIDTTGKASQAKVLDIETRKQNAKGGDLGEVDSADMKACITGAIAGWEFDPPPEVDYVHTYNGRVGEAF